MPAGAFSKLLGTIASFFQFGDTGGPGINANGAALETRNAANAAFAIHRGATPVAANDFATKAYVDGGSGGETFLIRFAITNAAAQSSVALIPSGAVILDARLDVTVSYSAGATLSLGVAGSVAEFMGTTDNTATAAPALYSLPQDTVQGGAAAALLVTVGGAPAAGAGFAMVLYSIPLV
jgi:hypothetical protein